MKKLLFIFVCLVLSNAKAQINFENVYTTGGYDYVRAIVQTYDSGYVTVGSSEVNSQLSDLYLLKVTPNGNIQWGKRYGGNNIDWGQDIIETYDSNLLIVGYTNSNTNSDYDIYVVKTTPLGDSIYTKTIGWNDWDFAYSVKETADSGYIIAGETYRNGNSDAVLIKLNQYGDTLWSKTYGGTGDDKFEQIIIAANGEFIITGVTESFGNQQQVYLVRTDNLGNIIWENNYGNAQNDFAKSLIEISTGEIYLAGATNTPPYPDYDNCIFKIDANGSYLWESKTEDYGPVPIPQNNDYYESIIEYKDSIVAGGNRTYDNSNPGNVYLEIQNKGINTGRYFLKYISAYFESIYDMKECKDGGIIIAASTEGFSYGGASIYLLKLDSNLNFPSSDASTISTKIDISSIENKTSVKKGHKIICYPNPTKSIINFYIENNNEPLKIVITDITGKQNDIIKSLSSIVKYDTYKLKNGIYFASFFINDTFVNQQKIIINR